MRTLLQLTMLGILAVGTAAQEAPNVLPSRVRDQLNQPSTSGAQQAPARPNAAAVKTPAQARPTASAKPARAESKRPASQSKAPVVLTKVPAGTPAHTTTKASAKLAGKSVSGGVTKASVAAPASEPVDEKVAVARRDPFDSLLTKARPGNGVPENLPPGKAGLMVGTVQITGIIRSGNGMIAIVANPQQRVYFLREGDKLYDGSVDHITLEAVSFHEMGKDAFGKSIEREVTKRLYPTPGEEQ